jgi:hypothetical protein
MSEYITEKIRVLHQLGFKKVTKTDFANAKNEIQVDQIARRIMMG